MPKKKGDGDMRARKQTLKFRNRPYIISAYAIGGKKKGKVPFTTGLMSVFLTIRMGKYLGKIGEQDVEDCDDGMHAKRR